ncbi:MAG: hypothetical protein QHH30_09755 [candidate division NC10 bacterium]|nr:hypothetical protein [candidate division NC10 bacterium]
MKKYAVALFAGLLILAIAAPLFAETYIDGMVFYRPRIYWNTDFEKGNANTNNAHILPILFLGAGYKAEDYAEAYFKLYTLGNNYSLGTGYAGVAPDKPYNDVGLANVYFDVKIPGTPVHYRLGRFNQSLGHGFYMNSGAYGGDGMKLWAPIGPVRVDLGYMKHNEQFDFANDIDQYFLQVAGSVAEGHQISAAFQWFEGRNMRIGVNPDGNSRYGGRDWDHLFTMWDPAITFDTHIWTLGVAADGAVPMGGMSISYRAEAVYAGGKLLDNFKKTDRQKEEDISGFALLAGGTANLGPATVTLEGAWGSGDKRSKAYKKNLGSGSKYEGFKVPMAQWGRSVWFDEWSFFDGSATGDPWDFGGTFGGGINKDRNRAAAAWHQRGLENLIYITLGASYTPITPLTLGIDVFKFWADETTPKHGFDADSRICWSKKQDNDLGWEIDLTAKWTLNKNFAVTGAFAPWFPGDYFKVPKNSWVVTDINTFDPSTGTGGYRLTKSGDIDWGYVLRANCVFTF